MISYLIYSTICMALVLLFYQVVLAREKISQINRWYLLIGLLFSLLVPILPIGIAGSMLNPVNDAGVHLTITNSAENTKTDSQKQATANSERQNYNDQASNDEWVSSLFFWLYISITLLMALRMIRHLFRMKLRSMKNPATRFKGHKVVLLDEEVVPHTFWKTIFVNRDQYKNGRISKEVMIHELIHAKQNHSLDIVIVEILKTVIWFNPCLYFYKTAIQLNHEYIADDKVISNGIDIADYQSLLLNMHSAKSAHYLSTSLNFKITKKRFKMMTLRNSTARSTLKTALIIPFLLILGITFGCKPAGTEKENQAQNISLELVNSGTIKLNGKTVPVSDFKSEFSDLSIRPEETVINLKVHKNTPTGLITDIQKVLRQQGTLRINYSISQPETGRAKEIHSSTLDNRRILNLYINNEGDIFVNQDRTSLSFVKKLVKQFITDNKESAGSSESPKNAIIAIKTDKRTPYNLYNSTLGKVREAYEELRNDASMRLFNKPFRLLPEASEERNHIKDMYPQKISIKEPFTG